MGVTRKSRGRRCGSGDGAGVGGILLLGGTLVATAWGIGFTTRFFRTKKEAKEEVDSSACVLQCPPSSPPASEADADNNNREYEGCVYSYIETEEDLPKGNAKIEEEEKDNTPAARMDSNLNTKPPQEDVGIDGSDMVDHDLQDLPTVIEFKVVQEEITFTQCSSSSSSDDEQQQQKETAESGEQTKIAAVVNDFNGYLMLAFFLLLTISFLLLPDHYLQSLLQP